MIQNELGEVICSREITVVAEELLFRLPHSQAMIDPALACLSIHLVANLFATNLLELSAGPMR